MSDAEYPITPAEAARLARDAYPELAAHTQPTITGDEQTLLYEAARAGYDLPLQTRRWRLLTHWEYPSGPPWQIRVVDGYECPGCGHHAMNPALPPGPLPCDGCSHVYIIPPPREQP